MNRYHLIIFAAALALALSLAACSTSEADSATREEPHVALPIPDLAQELPSSFTWIGPGEPPPGDNRFIAIYDEQAYQMLLAAYGDATRGCANELILTRTCSDARSRTINTILLVLDDLVMIAPPIMAPAWGYTINQGVLDRFDELGLGYRLWIYDGGYRGPIRYNTKGSIT